MILIPAREPFSFVAAARSHGWCRLAPFAWDDEHQELTRIEQLESGPVVRLRMAGAKGGVAVEVESAVEFTEADLAQVREKVSWMLRLDEDFSEFHALCRTEAALAQVVEKKQGRLLRSPTLFEDVVKTILTTNTTWSQTKGMVARLVEMLSQPFSLDPAAHVFPTPAQIAPVDEEFLTQQVRLGYRSSYVLELARRVASGELDLESWKHTDMETDKLRRQLKALKGVGDYAAANLLMLLGRYDCLAVDSWARKVIGQRFFPGKERVSDREIAAVFDRWEKWKFLAYWFYKWET